MLTAQAFGKTQADYMTSTDREIAYGTPEMADAVAQLINTQQFNSGGIFSMLGHEDGIVAFALTLKQAAEYLINCLAKALIIEKKVFSSRITDY